MSLGQHNDLADWLIGTHIAVGVADASASFGSRRALLLNRLKASATMDKPTIQVGSKKIEIWPEGQSLVVKVDPMIRVTRFDDIDDYHPGLIAQILAMERQGEGVRTRTSLPRTPFLSAWNRGSGRLA